MCMALRVLVDGMLKDVGGTSSLPFGLGGPPSWCGRGVKFAFLSGYVCERVARGSHLSISTEDLHSHSRSCIHCGGYLRHCICAGAGCERAFETRGVLEKILSFSTSSTDVVLFHMTTRLQISLIGLSCEMIYLERERASHAKKHRVTYQYSPRASAG